MRYAKDTTDFLGAIGVEPSVALLQFSNRFSRNSEFSPQVLFLEASLKEFGLSAGNRSCNGLYVSLDWCMIVFSWLNFEAEFARLRKFGSDAVNYRSVSRDNRLRAGHALACSPGPSRVLRCEAGKFAHCSDADLSMTLIECSLGRGASMLKRAGGSPI